MSRRCIVAVCAVVVFALVADGAAAAPKPARRRPAPRPDNAVSLEYEYENFGDNYDPWALGMLELSHRFDFGSVIGRINRARRFSRSGTQFEADAYPRLGKGMYLYTNVGFSNASIFPKQRFGAELYKSLPNSYEASIGFRQLNFENSNVTLYTGTIAKYKGNFYYSARPYVSRSTSGTSFSGQFMLRNYFATADDYVSFVATAGSAPTEDITPDAVNRRRSFNVRVTAQRTIIRNLLFQAQVGYRDEQIRQAAYRRGWLIGAGIEHRF